MYPTDRRYSREHEWAHVEQGRATVGITHFAQDQLGDVVYVELPAPGKRVARGDVLGTIESVKAVSEIYAPLSGRVVESNTQLADAPELINRDPHGAGWYCRLELEREAEVAELMDAAAYAEFARPA